MMENKRHFYSCKSVSSPVISSCKPKNGFMKKFRMFYSQPKIAKSNKNLNKFDELDVHENDIQDLINSNDQMPRKIKGSLSRLLTKVVSDSNKPKSKR